MGEILKGKRPVMSVREQASPTLIVVGGFPGTGKTAVSSRLSSEFGMPRLASDAIGLAIRAALKGQNEDLDAFRIGYDLLFCLCEEFIQSNVSVILDLTMGWAFHWRHIDEIVSRNPQALFLPVILRCPREQSMERIRQRHQAEPDHYGAPEVFTTEKVQGIWDYLHRLDRPEVHFVDSLKEVDQVYAEVKKYLMRQI